MTLPITFAAPVLPFPCHGWNATGPRVTQASFQRAWDGKENADPEDLFQVDYQEPDSVFKLVGYTLLASMVTSKKVIAVTLQEGENGCSGQSSLAWNGPAIG